MAAALGLALDLPEDMHIAAYHTLTGYAPCYSGFYQTHIFLSSEKCGLNYVNSGILEIRSGPEITWHCVTTFHVKREKEKEEHFLFLSLLAFFDLAFLWFLWLFYTFLHLSGFNQLPFHPNPSPNQLDCILSSVFKQITIWVLSLMFIKISPKTGLKSCSFVDQANPIIGWTFKPWQTIDDQLLGKSSMQAVTKGVFLFHCSRWFLGALLCQRRWSESDCGVEGGTSSQPPFNYSIHKSRAQRFSIDAEKKLHLSIQPMPSFLHTNKILRKSC